MAAGRELGEAAGREGAGAAVGLVFGTWEEGVVVEAGAYGDRSSRPLPGWWLGLRFL
jgi:hypothetical protein